MTQGRERVKGEKWLWVHTGILIVRGLWRGETSECNITKADERSVKSGDKLRKLMIFFKLSQLIATFSRNRTIRRIIPFVDYKALIRTMSTFLRFTWIPPTYPIVLMFHNITIRVLIIFFFIFISNIIFECCHL